MIRSDIIGFAKIGFEVKQLGRLRALDLIIHAGNQLPFSLTNRKPIRVLDDVFPTGIGFAQ